MELMIIVVCILHISWCSARVVPSSFRLKEIHSLNADNKMDEEIDNSVIKVPVQNLPNGVVEDVEILDFSGDMEDSSKSREMDILETEFASHSQMISSGAAETQNVENPLGIYLQNDTYLNTSHTNFSDNTQVFLSSFESHLNLSNIHVTHMNSTDLIFPNTTSYDLQQNFTMEEFVVIDETLLKENDTLSFNNLSAISEDKLKDLTFETQSENSFNQTDSSDRTSIENVTHKFVTDFLSDEVNSTNTVSENEIFVDDKENKNTKALNNQLDENTVSLEELSTLNSLPSGVTKNAALAFNFSDVSLTDHLIGEGELHGILDLVLPRHEIENSEQVLLNKVKENSHSELSKNVEAEINETLLLNATGAGSGHTKNSICPTPGVCLFWFFSQDECAEDQHCLGNRICCRVRCAKTCIEI